MSGQRKMTAAEYLVERGWTTDGDDLWSDPDGVAALSEEHAVTIQRARDAEEERKAWVAFAAAMAPALMQHGGRYTAPDDSPIGFDEAVKRVADGMLDAYRARFAVEIVDDPGSVS